MQNSDFKTDIAVIGAGLAGLTAAYRLHQRGYQVQVFEARPRVGGRVHTVRIKNLDGGYSIAELGGQNLNDGAEAKHIHSLIQELGLEVHRDLVDYTRRFLDGATLHDPINLLKKYDFQRDGLDQKLRDIARASNSMQDVLDKLIGDDSLLMRLLSFQLAGYEGSVPEKLCVYHNIDTFKYMLRGGMSSSYQADSDQKLRVNRVITKGGNAQIPLALAQKLESRVHLGKVLKRIESTSDERLQLTFNDGSKVLCLKLILAVPCSVLKDIMIDPKVLPEERLDQLQKIQYGTNGKIMIPSNPMNTDFGSLMTDTMGAFFNQDERLYTMYFTGESGAFLETHHDKYFAQGLRALKMAFPDGMFNESLPVKAIEEQLTPYEVAVVKSWTEDPFAKGSYSNYGVALGRYQAQTTTYKDIPVRALFDPISDQIFFAGEHTTMLDEIGTMEAAVESGDRAAQMVERNY